jgi:hypothetical protein
LREFSTNGGQGGNWATGIAIENADQPGARVYLEGFVTGSLQTALLADGLTYTQIELHGASARNDSQSLFVSREVGGGGSSIVAIFGGMNSSNAGTFPLWDVQNGGRMLVEDAWFEGDTSRAVRLTGTGTFTYWGGLLAPETSTPVNPLIELNGFSGRGTFGGVLLKPSGNASRGIVVSNETNQTNALFLGNLGYSLPYFSRTGSGGSVSFLNNKHKDQKGAVQTADQGAARTLAFITSMLEQMRTVKPTYTTGLPAGVTDARLFRVDLRYGATGLHIKP